MEYLVSSFQLIQSTFHLLDDLGVGLLQFSSVSLKSLLEAVLVLQRQEHTWVKQHTDTLGENSQHTHTWVKQSTQV